MLTDVDSTLSVCHFQFTVHQHNMIFKYADDTYLIVPDMFSRTIPQELQHISDWAKHHNLKLKQTISLEIIISLQTSQYILQELIPNGSWCHIQRKTSFWHACFKYYW